MKNNYSFLLVIIVLVSACKKKEDITQSNSIRQAIPAALNGTRMLTGEYNIVNGDFEGDKKKLKTSAINNETVKFTILTDSTMTAELSFQKGMIFNLGYAPKNTQHRDTIGFGRINVAGNKEYHFLMLYAVPSNDVYSIYYFVDTIDIIKSDSSQNHQYILKEKK